MTTLKRNLTRSIRLFSVLSVGIISAGCSQQALEPDSSVMTSKLSAEIEALALESEATRELVEKFNAAWVKNDDVTMATLVSDDVYQSFPPFEETIKIGRDKVVPYLTGKEGSTADAILKVETMVRVVHKLVVEGDTAVGFHTMSAELRNGGDYSSEYIWRITCKDGKVVRLDGMVDRLHVMQQIGDQPILNEMAKQE